MKKQIIKMLVESLKLELDEVEDLTKEINSRLRNGFDCEQAQELVSAVKAAHEELRQVRDFLRQERKGKK